MEEMTIKERIEFLVTNSLGYNSQTDFIEGNEFLSKTLNLTNEEIKNTEKGLQAHLAHLDSKTRSLDILRQKRASGDYRDYTQLKLLDKTRMAFQLIEAENEYRNAKRTAILSIAPKRLVQNTLYLIEDIILMSLKKI